MRWGGGASRFQIRTKGHAVVKKGWKHAQLLAVPTKHGSILVAGCSDFLEFLSPEGSLRGVDGNVLNFHHAAVTIESGVVGCSRPWWGRRG